VRYTMVDLELGLPECHFKWVPVGLSFLFVVTIICDIVFNQNYRSSLFLHNTYGNTHRNSTEACTVKLGLQCTHLIVHAVPDGTLRGRWLHLFRVEKFTVH